MLNQIDLSKLPKPKIIEELSLEAIFEEAVRSFKTHLESQNAEGVFDALIASDPAIKLIEYWSYREFLLRQRINDAFSQTLLAYGRGEALDHMAAAWNIGRGVTAYDDEGQPIEWQNDDDLRTLIQLAPERITTAGSRMSYIFHALNMGRKIQKMDVDKIDQNTLSVTYHLNQNTKPLLAIRDVNVHSPQAGCVDIAALSYDENGEISDDALQALKDHLNGDFIRPLTDYITVTKGENKEFSVVAELEVMSGVDAAMILEQAYKNLSDFVTQRYRLGETASIAGIYDALHTQNIRSVKLLQPAADVTCLWDEAPKCTLIELKEAV